VLDCATVGVELSSDDTAALDFVVEYFDPWFRVAQRRPEWVVTLSTAASTYARMRAQLPPDATLRPCFAHDQQVLSLPTWFCDDVVNICDRKRSCFLRIRPGRVDLIAEAGTRRWRFTLLWVVQEIAATRLRQSHVDVHAASVERSGRALLIAGPKNAGKTTLSFHLMKSCGFGLIANDRSFVDHQGAAPAVVGMPTAVKVRPPTMTRFPELCRGLPPVARPYLYSRTELDNAEPSEEPVGSVDFALTPNQIGSRLGAESHAAATLGAMVFPQVCDDEPVWSVERLTPDEVVAAVLTNLYGAATGERPATFFERFGGGRRHVSHALVTKIAAGVAGYRVRLGRDAYAGGALGARLSELLSCG
jgi:hypothetical protein